MSPQINYGQQPEQLLGQVVTNENAVIDSLTNELLGQVSELTVGGTVTAGVYSATVTGPDGETVTVSVTRVAETSDGVSDLILAAILADDDWLNVAVPSDSGTEDVQLDFVHPGRVYTFELAAPAPGTLVVATSQTAGGVDIELGVAVQEGSADDLVAVLAAGAVDDDLAGIVVRGIDALVNDLGATESVFAPNSTLSVLRRGECVVLVEEAVTKGGDCFVRLANPAAGDPVGLFRTDVDGGDAIAMTGTRFSSTTTGRGLARVRINRP